MLLCYSVAAVSHRFKKEGELFHDFDPYNIDKWLTLKENTMNEANVLSIRLQKTFSSKKVMVWHVTA